VNQSQFLSQCTADALHDAAKKLAQGALVAFPTETVYGLGVDATNRDAVTRMYAVKGRPADHPVIVHVSSMQAMGQWASDIPDYAIALARKYWPGPMTLILKRSELAEDFVTGGQDSVGLRVPDHKVALALLAAFESIGGKGVAAPSANRFGHLSPTSASAVSDELSDYLGDGDVILDGGSCDVGVESTIIDCTGALPRVLRPGAISPAMIADAIGVSIEQIHTSSIGNTESDSDFEEIGRAEIRVSGSLENHYAPDARVLLDVDPTTGQGFIALASIPTPSGVIRLGAPINDEEFARILYASLRTADEQGLAEVVVAQPMGDGIALAIRDRLRRAAN
jgi:L-threonylcarbamoyladenylate synthase